MNWLRNNFSGIFLSFIIAILSTLLGNKFPIIGGSVFGILIGLIINNFIGLPAHAYSGIKFTSKKILQYSIILLGTGLSLTQVWKTSLDSLAVMLATLLSALASAFIIGKLFKIPINLVSLIGVGTAICGGSAIAAISPIIEAEENEVAYSISTIFFFNIIAVLLFPTMGHLIGFSDTAFGLWAGTAINDTSSVVAAGYAFSDVAGNYATIVKLTRTTMIIPISLVFAAVTILKKKRATKAENNLNYSFKRIFPWFIVGFMLASLLNTLGILSQNIIEYLTTAGKFMIVMALSAIGLSSDLKAMIKTGLKPLLLGFIVWLIVSVVSIGVQFLNGQM